jgi:hypothetical protein
MISITFFGVNRTMCDLVVDMRKIKVALDFAVSGQ